MDFADVSVKGIPLVLVVLGLVAYLGKLGVKGKAQLISSMLIGLVLGAGYQLSQSVPAGYSGWFGVVIYGLGLGLVASGIYETGMKMAKAQGTALGKQAINTLGLKSGDHALVFGAWTQPNRFWREEGTALAFEEAGMKATRLDSPTGGDL